LFINGLFNNIPTPVTLNLIADTITGNQANGGPAGAGGSAGSGVGGGVYLAPFAIAHKDAATDISGNSASTADNDVHGNFLPNFWSLLGSILGNIF